MPEPILPSDWDPTAAADRVMAGLINVCAPAVKGAHDADLLLRGDRAYVLYEANDVKPGEAANWPFIYDCMSVVDLTTNQVVEQTTYAASEMEFANMTLPHGCAFVTRGVWLDDRRMRVYFSSEDPGARQSLTFYRDYDAATSQWADTVHPLILETATDGAGDMTPARQHADAAAQGFAANASDHGLLMIDGIKSFDGRHVAILNNFGGGILSFGEFNATLDRVRILGHAFEPQTQKYTEAAVNRLPNGDWKMVARTSSGDFSYRFSTSPDGVTWSPFVEQAPIANGASSRSSFDVFDGIYYLGWQQANPDCDTFRSTYNVDVSRDGLHWERKYHFVSDKSFHYPVFREHRGTVYLAVTQGDTNAKERIMFGTLEDLPR